MKDTNQWPSVLRTIPRALFLLFRAAPVLSSLQAAITVVRAVIPLLVLGVAKLFVDVATDLIGGRSVALPLVGVPADSAQGLYLLGALLLSVWVLDKATWVAEEVVRTHSTNRVESHVHALIMRKCSTLDAPFYESPGYLDMLERAVRGALMNAMSFMWGFYFLMSSATSLVATVVVLSTIHWAVPVAMVLSALPQLIATSYFARRGWALENSLAEHYRLLKYLTALMSERQAANEVRLFGLSDYFIPRFWQINEHRIRREQSLTRNSTFWRAGLGLVSDAAVAGVWVFIALRALARTISLGDVVLGTQAAWRGKQALEATFSHGRQFFEQSLTLVNLFAFLDLDPAGEMAALAAVMPGEVLVYHVDTSVAAALFGELFGLAARAQGARGAVLDGPVRDIRQLREQAFPVFANGVSPYDTRGRAEVVAHGVPIVCGGVDVVVGDLIVADDDGVIVVPASHAAAVVATAVTKTQGELGARADLIRGVKIHDVWESGAYFEALEPV